MYISPRFCRHVYIFDNLFVYTFIFTSVFLCTLEMSSNIFKFFKSLTLSAPNMQFGEILYRYDCDD